jgi:hypothetical protein
MVLCLQLATGEIRKYEISYSGLGEDPNRYTKCGKVWFERPEQMEECDHLDCALMAAERDASHAILFLVFWSPIIILGGEKVIDFASVWTIFMVAFGALILAFTVWILYRSLKHKCQLDEYKLKGTIGGVRAWKYTDSL